MAVDNPEQLREDVLNHFESLATEYDQYKSRSVYYYNQLKLLLKELIPNHSNISIVEIGCGTGQLLRDLNPVKGLGVDISPKMIEIARKNSTHLDAFQYEVGDAETVELRDAYEAFVLCDVLEHLYDPEAAIRQISDLMNPGNSMVLTWANSIWEPILHLLEKLKMKMPEGAHNWESRKTVMGYLEKSGFRIIDEGTRCIVPARLPLADTVNRLFHKVPLIKKLGLIRYIHAQR